MFKVISRLLSSRPQLFKSSLHLSSAYSNSQYKIIASNMSGAQAETERVELKSIDSKLLKQHTIPLNQPVVTLDCTEAFDALSTEEKLYAHYLSKACWAGGLIVAAQTSPESPAILALIYDAFASNGIKGLEEVAKNDCGFSDEDWKAFVVYCCGIINGYGNYKGYGDSKIIPNLSEEKLSILFCKCKLNSSRHKEMVNLLNEVGARIYSLDKKFRLLGLGEKGVTTYFSANCNSEDTDIIGRFLKENKIEPWNTRAFKTVVDGVAKYEIRSASYLKPEAEKIKSFDFEGCKFELTSGDYSPIMKLVVEYLNEAKNHALNETEKKMLEFYIKSFTEGSLNAHKDGSRYWIKDQGPVIETYIGFIESYRDPVGARAEFEGFVSVVNKSMSLKFGALVTNAEKILSFLPWPKEFERQTFIKPDFTSLDVLTFAGSGIPSGINIPNYDEIRQKEGFKNVTLGNVITSNFKNVDVPFFSKENKKILNQYFVKSYEFQTGLHELLGHGSGLNFVQNEDGTTNFPADLRNPLTNELVEGVYQVGETYNSVFTDLASPYEECRAETVGLVLSVYEDVQKIYGFEGEEGRNVRDANWLTALYDGIRSVEMYQPDSKSWMQAHSHAAFVTLQVLIEAGQNLIKIEEVTGSDGKPDLLAQLDFNAIETVGLKALSDFILKIQIYKSTADVKSAKAMFDAYSEVSDEGSHPWARWRDIVLERKLPKKMFVQGNTSVSKDKTCVSLKQYESCPEGIIQSFLDRLPGVDVSGLLEWCYEADKKYF